MVNSRFGVRTAVHQGKIKSRSFLTARMFLNMFTYCRFNMKKDITNCGSNPCDPDTLQSTDPNNPLCGVPDNEQECSAGTSHPVHLHGHAFWILFEVQLVVMMFHSGFAERRRELDVFVSTSHPLKLTNKGEKENKNYKTSPLPSQS